MSPVTQKINPSTSDKPDFITVAEYNSKKAGSFDQYIRYAPESQPDGYYWVKFLGKITNTNANWEGYLSTGTYFLHQLVCVKNFAFALVENLAAGADFSIVSIILLVIGFILGILIRLPIGILLTIAQLIARPFISKNNQISNNSF